MRTTLIDRFLYINKLAKGKMGWSCTEIMLVLGCIVSFAILSWRSFLGTEITDEAYYVSNAITTLHGNIPYAYNNDALTFGAYFLLIPQIFIYELFVPSMEGVFLFSRLSFLVFKGVILWSVYYVLRKSFSRSSVLISIIILIPFAGGMIHNYSYNAIPAFLSFLVAVVLYDVIEQKHIKPLSGLFLSGFVCALSFFAHCAYAVSIIFFCFLILFRSERGNKIRYLFYYAMGGISEVLIIFLPIIMQSGLRTLGEGLILYINPFPTAPMSSSTGIERLLSVLLSAKLYFLASAVVILISSFFVVKYLREGEEKYTNKEIIIISVMVGYITCLMIVGIYGVMGIYDASSMQYITGLITSIYVIIFLCIGLWKKDSFFLYSGVYPVIFAISMAFMTGSNDPLTRFAAVIPALVGVGIALQRMEKELVTILTYVLLFSSLLILGYSQCRFVYRDSDLSFLNTRVESGVYKGLYTTEQRARDLPEMERVINEIVTDDDYYAFRDNVPFAYLMVHKGKMCELNTWDCLQYTYDLNEPAKLFAYYKRMGHIPDKIIYIDFGRDEKLSLDDGKFRYNDFVEKYYSVKNDFYLNNTFYRVVVLENNNTFDDDYDYWIKTYYHVANE